MPSSVQLDDQRQWISFEDPDEERTWLFDATFLLSNWTCIYGAGCPGIEHEPDVESQLGCCNHGAWISDEDDLKHVRRWLAELDSGTWQHHDTAERLGGALYQDDDGYWRTRVHDGVCIFQNRPDHPGGAGCAFHQYAVQHGHRPVDVKPEVCWQVPLRREDHETETGHLFTMVREWQVRDWGGEPDEFGWWCTHEAEAHVGAEPVYLALRDELTAVCGDVVYDQLVDLLEAERSTTGEVWLPHPAVRNGG